MIQYKVTTTHHEQLADTTTPVSIYLKIRDRYPNALLLESSEYDRRENSYSYVCCDPIASFIVENGVAQLAFPDGKVTRVDIKRDNAVINSKNLVPDLITKFIDAFEVEKRGSSFLQNGLFGYMSYEAVQYFENIELHAPVRKRKYIPEIQYQLFRFVIVLDHFKNHLHILKQQVSGEVDSGPSMIDLTALIRNKRVPQYAFSSRGEESSNLTNEEYMAIVERGKHHCRRGDVFQIVLSREFGQEFRGDDFNVYRALRSINPSPYLFYFDYGGFRIFGSSPEGQLTIRNDVARINPIAGTCLRTGDDAKDRALAEKLRQDKKENAEHVMLVDLARNDLSRHAEEVSVETFREIHFYSHVIHMVSEVAGKVSGSKAMQIAADTFPAGTLSGAPKYKAMQLIDKYEPDSRSFYGGAIGFIGFHGEFNHAITIRSFLSKNNLLIYQAGAGIVVDSVAEGELQEVNNKIAALRNAIKMAETV
jgi:anthranilate synthase component I